MSSEQAHLSHPKYRPDIDGLRAVAVLAVVAFHAFPKSGRGGFIGVDVFFVISGYLISTILFENLDKGTFSFAEFYGRRIKRIFPALILVMLASFSFGWFALLPDEFKQFGKHMAAGAGFVSNIVLWNEAGYFDSSAATKPLLHLWSLGIEEQFYIVWPLLLWVGWKRKFNFLAVTLFIAMVSFVLNINSAGVDAVATFYSPQTRFWELLSGSTLAWLTLYRSEVISNCKSRLDDTLYSVFLRKKNEGNGKIAANIISIVGLLLLFSGFWEIDPGMIFPGYWALIPIFAAILIISAGPDAWANKIFLSNRLAVWFGLISFPLYLWHWPLLSFARIIEGELPGGTIRAGIVVFSIFMAWVTRAVIERPFRNSKANNYKVNLLFFAMCLIGIVGYSTYYMNGFSSRDSMKNYNNIRNEVIETAAISTDCLQYVNVQTPLFTYCRFTSAHSSETVAVIGDSHAGVAYFGIAELLRAKGINTVLLANDGCPTFLGIASGIDQGKIEKCRLGTNQAIETLISLKDVKKVFVFTRGPLYWTGLEPASGAREKWGGNNISLNQFRDGAQRTIQSLSEHGKIIYYVSENPELAFPPSALIDRPFRSAYKKFGEDKASVLNRQSEYLTMLKSLKNVTVIDTIDTFCPAQKCLAFDGDGALLYADSNHLSISGSKFQANQILSKYLN